MKHPTQHLAGWTGILQADAYGGYTEIYSAQRKPAPALRGFCWSHARRKFFELADIKGALFKNGGRKGKKVAEEISPVALEAVKRFDAIFDIEREITRLNAESRHDARQKLVRPLVADLHDGRRAKRARMSRHNPVAKAIPYMFEADSPRGLHPVPRRRPHLPCEQSRRARPSRRSPRSQSLALCRIATRRSPRRMHVFPDRHGEDERRRSSGRGLADVLARMPGIVVSRLPELLP